MLRGVQAYADEVRTRRFPGPEHTYGIAPEELDRFREDVGKAPRPALTTRSHTLARDEACPAVRAQRT